MKVSQIALYFQMIYPFKNLILDQVDRSHWTEESSYLEEVICKFNLGHQQSSISMHFDIS